MRSVQHTRHGPTDPNTARARSKQTARAHAQRSPLARASLPARKRAQPRNACLARGFLSGLRPRRLGLFGFGVRKPRPQAAPSNNAACSRPRA
eukprot:10562739-Alexandrium_andersonii.AAC.1